MQADIHPAYHQVKVTCSCGNAFSMNSTLPAEDLNLDVCNKCHPFYTGNQKVIDSAGRLQAFKKKYAKK